ncbi:hypothetical protein PM10SUCC1_26260 [Propionigenium maris DSM 9537]|uniref:Uncharacterized protein n=1 Tax=Propionigenium maris DSM 9537 TaxID=1123000 RepID=A0A9W6GMN7_9FUSO|nr:three component ABC system middle component [Propionigenium maris]GLI57112.1 hypothetical protein PM10SUCC1_26260 [Propionigenium maris DSM 9537]
MSSFGQKLIKVTDNPFFIAEILAVAFENFIDKRRATLWDAYLIIPLILKKRTRERFVSTNKTGTIINLFSEIKKVDLLSLEEDVKVYKKKVNKAIIIGIERGIISLNKETLSLNGKKTKGLLEDENYRKASQNIGKIFSKYEVYEIFEFMEVYNI